MKRPLFPVPVAPYPKQSEDRPSTSHTGKPDPDDPTDLIVERGMCRSFCACGGPERGQTIEQHGITCSSVTIGASSDIYDDKLRAASVYADLVSSYTHGVYRRADVWGRSRADFVRVNVEGKKNVESNHLTASQARSLAAALVRAADRLEFDPIYK